VAALPEKQRATLILKVYHDLTHEEVAGILGSSVGTVKANLFHALANLRKRLSQAGVGEAPAGG
jgi:DNA-directed RNA polymerase specialized sigma24 family protein